jgi:hypothetical protein
LSCDCNTPLNIRTPRKLVRKAPNLRNDAGNVHFVSAQDVM